MALSQKHSGKVFVPWFNTSEWKHVYNLLCDDTEKDYQQALTIINIWKFRTPLLSAGVEGTLILLEALLAEKEKVSDAQLTQSYALSLMRFLNICAANNDKQGTFHRTAMKNDLPKWLISIRHDIAHDHKLPSRPMLELGLNQSLDWLKTKYWEVQRENISDYEVTDESVNTKTIEILNVYVRLKLNLFCQVDISEYDESLFNKINDLIYKKYKVSKTDIRGMIGILEEMLRQSFALPENEEIGEKAAKILVEDRLLLSIMCETTADGQEIIPRDFRDIWTDLLNILYENNLLFRLLDRLLEVTNNSICESNQRRVASMWICEIFQGLIKTQNIKDELDSIIKGNSDEIDPKTGKIILKSILDKKNPEFKNCLEFDSPNYLPSDDATKFQDKALNLCNEYTVNFLQKVLIFNRNNEDFIAETINLVKKLTWQSGNNTWDDRFLTAGSLEDILSSNLSTNIEMDQPEEMMQINNVSDSAMPTSKWTRIKDTSAFQGCPLGILPHQNRSENPLISFL